MTKETDTMVTLPVLKDLTFREWHHFINGVYCGVRSIEDEPETQVPYWRCGYLIGMYFDDKF